tara:strand:- start:392 stop:1639 length:1248 start_codon:yes stop_codon:yes gene_type:complete
MGIESGLIGAGASLLGGFLQGESAENAAGIQAGAQTEAARIAANEARFRPVGITTRFGGSQFQFGIPGVSAPVASSYATPAEFQAAQSAYQTRLANEGRVTGASYTLDPALRAYQDRFLGLAGRGLTQAEAAQQQFAPLGAAAQGLFGLGQQYLTPSAGIQGITSLGQQYLAESPEQAAEKYILGRQNLLAPSRERQLSGLRTNLFNTGRQGLSVGGTGVRPGGGEGLRAANPEMEAYYNAIAQEDARLAAEGMQAGLQQVRFGADLLGQGQALEQGRLGFGAGLFGTGGNLLTQGYGGQTAALGPYQAYLQGATGLEALGQQPLELGSALGGRIANPAGGQALFQGGMGAAQSNFAANAYNPFATALTGFSQNPALVRGASSAFGFGNAGALDSSAYGRGGLGYQGAQYDIYGR